MFKWEWKNETPPLILGYCNWYKLSLLFSFWFEKSISNWFKFKSYDKTMEWEVSEK